MEISLCLSFVLKYLTRYPLSNIKLLSESREVVVSPEKNKL